MRTSGVSLPPAGPSEAGPASEPGARFVRAATLAQEGAAQRIHVLMQDDLLGRISLRMVDRAGLIQAVVRTEGARAAQVISDSLPALFDSLAQRGLSAAGSPGGGFEQQAEARQGQPRRQRHSGGQGTGGGGRKAGGRAAETFRVEVR